MKIYYRSIAIVLLVICIACTHKQPKLRPLHSGDTILAFGDSLTYGTGANANANYPAVLETLSGYHVINAGVPGEETRDSLQRISQVLEQTQPQLVILCLGGNDLLRKRPSEIIKQNLKTLIRTIKASGAQVILVAVPEPTLRMHVPVFYSELGEEMKVPVLLETLPRLLGDNKYKSDYIHLNDQGYRLLAADLIAFMAETGAIKSR